MFIAIAGANGMLGTQVDKAAKARGHRTLLLTRSEKFAGIDLSQLSVAPPAVSRSHVDVLINCVGALPGARDTELALSNAYVPHMLATWCELHSVRMIHVSTDCVFSGDLPSKQCYDYTMPPDPTSLYGRTKYAGEPRAATVVRTSFIGFEHGFLHWLLNARGTISAYLNAIWSGAAVWHVADVLVRIAEREFSDRPLHHVASEPVSKAWMVEYLSSTLDLPVTVQTVKEPSINRALCPTIMLPPVKQSLDEVIEIVKSEKEDRE